MQLSIKEQIQALIDKFVTGDIAALARVLTLAENSFEYRTEIMSQLYPMKKEPAIIGITGAPGVGKSTLINQLLFEFKKRLAPIAVLAFDPTSEKTGGAILGDRLRMSDHISDKRVYIRSMANRGHLGGVASVIYDALIILSAFGFELIIIETVGVGQAEIDIMRASDVVLVVLVPNFGDDLQMMKAGILEIGDVFVLNKDDLPGSEKLKSAFSNGLFSNKTGISDPLRICSTCASNGKGIEQLAELIFACYQELKENGHLQQRIKHRKIVHFQQILLEKWQAIFVKQFNNDVTELMHGCETPYQAAERHFNRVLKIISKDDLDPQQN